MLVVENLCAGIEGKRILNRFSLTVHPGEIHAIMGPNGAGKSTLAKILGGHPSYELDSGTILFQGEEMSQWSPEEKALKGLFISFQYPPEIEGVPMEEFLQAAVNAHRLFKGLPKISQESFHLLIKQKMESLLMREEFRQRSVNEGFSGGEKKRNEILQMALLEPKLAILDETDSGLDIDALRCVAAGVRSLAQPDRSMILITHYQRLLEYIEPHFVHVMIEGRIVRTGGPELAHELETRGYDWLQPMGKEA